MLTNFPTAKVVKSIEISKPPTIIEPVTMPILINSFIEMISGIASFRPTSAAPKSRVATTPDQIPCLAAVERNGRMMYHLVAPTNFSVLIR